MMYAYSLDMDKKLHYLYFDIDGKVMKGQIIRYDYGDGVAIDFAYNKCYDYFKEICKSLEIKVRKGCVNARGVISVDDYIKLSIYCKMSLNEISDW